MPSDSRRPERFLTTPVGFVILSLIMLLVASVFSAVAVIYMEINEFASTTLSTAMSFLAAVPAILAMLLSIAFLLVGSIRWALFGRRADGNANLNLNRFITILESINQRLLLSETAKKIAYRTEDIAVLHQTIRDDIRRGEYDEAMVLVAQLAETYGQLEESEKFREHISTARTQEIEQKVAERLERLDRHLDQREFAEANKEASRLKRLYSESPSVANLEHRVEVSREQHKKDLEREFLLASERDEVDRALELMHELDGYLTREEAEPFQEVARGVIGKKRDNLGVQFKLAVHDGEWAQAVKAGQLIIQEFPNTRMADEVRSMIDLLHERAAGQTQATT